MGDEAKKITEAYTAAMTAKKTAYAAAANAEGNRLALVRMRKHVDGLLAAEHKKIENIEKILDEQMKLIGKDEKVLARQEGQVADAAKRKKKKK